MKRKKNEEPEPIYLKAAPQFGERPAWTAWPADLYDALQPTLVNDFLEWKTTATKHTEPALVLGYYIPCRQLLDLARIWKTEPRFIRLEVDLENAYLVILTDQDETGKFWSKSTLKLVVIEELPDWREGRPHWATNETFIPFALTDGDAPQPETQPTDPWIAKACSRDEARPTLARAWGDFAADGYRLHIDPRLQPVTTYPEWTNESEIDALRRSIEEIRSHPAENFVTVDAKALAKAAKAARTVNKEIIRLSVNGRLDVYGIGEETGQAGHYLTEEHGYQHAGPDLEVGIDPRFLLDALTGFSGEIVISLGGASGTATNSPLTLTDGIREAVIMPKQIGAE